MVKKFTFVMTDKEYDMLTALTKITGDNHRGATIRGAIRNMFNIRQDMSRGCQYRIVETDGTHYELIFKKEE